MNYDDNTLEFLGEPLLDVGEVREEPQIKEPTQEEVIVEEETSQPTEEEFTDYNATVDDPEKGEPAEDVETEEGEPEEVETEPEFEVELSTNPIAIIAEQWKSDGRLPEDLEINAEITPEELDKVFYEHLETQSKSQLTQAAKEEVLKEYGLDEKSVETAKLLHYGVSDRDIQLRDTYSHLAQVEVNPDAENYESQVKDLGFNFYIDKGFSEEMATKFIERDLEEVELDVFVNTYKAHFKDQALTKAQDIEDKAQAKKDADAAARRSYTEKVDTLLTGGVIAETKYSPKQIDFVRKAMNERNHVYTDKDGRSFRVTLEEKKIREHRDNPEKHLKARIDFILGYDQVAVNKSSEEKGKKDLLKNLKNVMTVKPKKAVTEKKKLKEVEDHNLGEKIG